MREKAHEVPCPVGVIPMEDLLTVEEISKKCKVPINTVREWIRKNKLVGVKLGKHWRVKESDLESFIEERTNKSS